MSVLDPYLMPEYYWVEENDLVSGMQVMNMVNLNNHTWEPYPSYSYGVEDYYTPPTQLNPSAPDFSPRQAEPPGEKIISDTRVAKTKRHYPSNYPMKMSPVSMDLVLAANYMLNDIFGFIAPQIPIRQKPRYKDTKHNPAKKAMSPKLPRSRSPSPCSVPLVKPEISYGKEELMAIAKSPLCQVTPQAWPMIAKKMPRLVRREGPTANIIIKEVRAIKKQGETGQKVVK